MTNSRRKLKKERELISDIRKALDNRCRKTPSCWECPFNQANKTCLQAYAEFLLEHINDGDINDNGIEFTTAEKERKENE